MTVNHPLHPGILVKDALIDNTGLSVTEAANHLGITRTTLSRLLNGHAGISPEMALRLAKFFETSIEHWLNLQTQYDIWLVNKRWKKIKVKPYKKAA
ncbi:MAG: HigA family addiction module antitoxin [Coxiellaceae bacterium]|nr:HigA family addiction module antitoxin [Coxiellaceae bacterium]